MRNDEQVAHAQDIQTGSGKEFYGTPVRELCLLDVALREQDDLQMRIRASLGTDSALVELLPDETIKDNLIQRKNAAVVALDKALYFDLDLPRVKNGSGWKSEDLLDENGKMLKAGEFFREAPEALRRTFKDNVWYDAEGKAVTFELPV